MNIENRKPVPLMSVHDVAEALKFSVHHVRQRIVTRPDFPSPLMIGRTKRWRPDSVEKWINAQVRR